jgi:hypothetical protein
MTDACSIEDCESSSYVRGWCVKHYERWRAHGDPTFHRSSRWIPNPDLMVQDGLRAMDVPVRPGYERVAAHILSRCEPGPEGCWLWTGALDPAGYGRRHRHLDDPHVSSLVHRALYAALVEPPDPGLHLDHLCRQRACANPGHLDLVSQRVNLTRGIGRIAQFARAKFCIAGHRFDEANTYITKSGTRMCRKCNARRQRETKARRLAKIAAAKPAAKPVPSA